jgi:tRNA-dihydrouridine synthase 3
MAADTPEANGSGPSLKRSLEEQQLEPLSTEQPILPGDSTITKAEKIESQAIEEEKSSRAESPSRKRARISSPDGPKTDGRERVKGIAPVKPE